MTLYTITEETKRRKAKQLRYKKPIAKDLNLDKIQEDLWNIQEACEEIRWYTDSEDGEDSLCVRKGVWIRDSNSCSGRQQANTVDWREVLLANFLRTR